MNKFTYRAKDQQGKTLTRVVEARDEKQALSLLHTRRLIVISLSLEKEKGLRNLVRVFQKISFNDVVNFSRQLSTMITAGLSLTNALALLEVQLSPAMARGIGDVLRKIEDGGSLAEALSRHPKVFSKVYIALIRAGESAGVLDKVLARLADNLEKQRDFKSQVKGAMIYPIIVLIAMAGVAAVMMIFVLPKMMSLYQEFGAELPLPTRILMGISKFSVSFWWLGLTFILVFIYGVSFWKKTKIGQRQYDQLLFKIPIFGNLNKKVILTEFTRTLGLLINTGIPIVEGLNIVAEATGNEVYREDIDLAAKKVEKGFPLAISLAESGSFPPIVSQMISVGEETGKVDQVLNKLSKYLEAESEQTIKGLTSAMEPLIIVILGIGVGFLVIAVIMPIYNLTSQF